MRKTVAGLVVLSLTLAGCSGWRDSRINPGNWFGNSRAEARAQSATPAQTNPLIPEETSIFRRNKKEEVYLGTPVDQIVDLAIERTSSGAIVKATGQTLQQGAYDVRLTSDTEGAPVDGVLTLEMKALQPLNTPQGPERVRRVTAGYFLSNQDLDQTRTIRVLGDRNARSSSR
jgi:hypothetical protein